ncbi:two-component system cell cycle sensor histidine kinase/response regulator CckA [Rhodovulum iodosum]|uniref:histidine kinase n=1 Tax=Rhodovulum iodosum TaxID=68291 RepID=A0ABV3XU28_9RHOB|nr:ATP-binding protein [Rhodovulum robiginosum]RSK32269.1 response regulator [Rhodovulum robiginosum]
MPRLIGIETPLTRLAALEAPRAGLVLALGLVFVLAALLAGGWPVRAGLLGAGATLCALAALLRLLADTRGARRAGRLRAAAAALAERQPAPGFATDADGALVYATPSAEARFGVGGDGTLVRALGELFANPAAVIYRLQARAAAEGAASEEVVTRRGFVKIAVHRFGCDGFFWVLDEREERPGTTRGASGLGLPVLTAGQSGTILYLNDAARALLGGQPRRLDQVFPRGLPRPGALARIAGDNGPVSVRFLEIAGRHGRREIYLWPQEALAEMAGPDLFESLPVALLKLTPEGEVQLINHQARALLGVSGEATVDFCARIEGPGRPVRDWLADTAQGRAAHRAEVVRVLREDRDLFVQVTLERIDAPGAPELLAVLHDATEFKTLEAQFVQSQKMQAIGQLAGGIAHDFNNLLTAISGHCELLLLRHDEGDPDFGDLVQISQNANRAASLVGQLLAFSRKQTLRPEIVDLRNTLTDLTHLLNRLVGETVRLSLVHDPDLPPIRADKRQLEQVILNLVVNARDAMPAGGQVRIETVRHRLGEDLHRDRAVVPAGDFVLVRVVDEGVGIPRDKLAKVFEPFYSTKRPGEGTGLGLSTAYGIVKQSGGFIFVDSAVGAGTCFTLYFPASDRAAEAPAPPAERPADPAAARPCAGVVLLVEDETPVRAFAARALRMRGLTVLEADSAERALELLADPAVEVDVFVTDVVMPGRDGPSWVREALADRPDTRVIFVSGYAEAPPAMPGGDIPHALFLPKPFSLRELTETVQRQIH